MTQADVNAVQCVPIREIRCDDGFCAPAVGAAQAAARAAAGFAPLSSDHYCSGHRAHIMTLEQRASAVAKWRGAGANAGLQNFRATAGLTKAIFVGRNEQHTTTMWIAPDAGAIVDAAAVRVHHSSFLKGGCVDFVGTMSINIQGYPTLFTTGSGHYMNPTNAKETLCDLYRTWMYLKHNADLPAVFLTPGNARLMAGFMDLGFQEQNDLWTLLQAAPLAPPAPQNEVHTSVLEEGVERLARREERAHKRSRMTMLDKMTEGPKSLYKILTRQNEARQDPEEVVEAWCKRVIRPTRDLFR